MKILIALLSLAMTTTILARNGEYDRRGTATYEVTVQNLTKGQPFSPPLVVIHDRSVSIFKLGEKASAGLAVLAEDGDGAPLKGELAPLQTQGKVTAVSDNSDLILPGASQTINLTGKKQSVLSLAGMLVRTNDGFVGLNAVPLPRRKGSSYKTYAVVYDAGSEENNESCDYIPAPPCGNPGKNSGQGSEGFVHPHPGLQNVGDIDPISFAFGNKAALITIKRIN